MTLSSKLGMKTGKSVISLQRSGSGWILSFSSGNAKVEIHTDVDVETGAFEGSDISETDYGYKGTVRTQGPPKSLGAHDDIYILGSFRRTVIENDRKCDFYFKDRKVHTGKNVRLRRPSIARTSRYFDRNSNCWTKTEKLKQ